MSESMTVLSQGFIGEVRVCRRPHRAPVKLVEAPNQEPVDYPRFGVGL
jgi:hypothetical protein